MGRPRRPLRPRSDLDRGAAAVEFALLTFVFFPLVFGMVSAGIAFSRQITITQAAREASRYGSTLSFQAAGGGVDEWLRSVTNAAEAAAGDGGLTGYDSVCVAYVEPGGAATAHMIDGGAAVTGDPCPGTDADAALQPAYVQVVLTRDTPFVAVFMNPTITLSAASVTPYEAGPG